MTEIRTALVTGADRGFGLSVARELLQRGWRVFAGRVLRDYPLLVYPREGYSVEKFADKITFLADAPLFDFAATDIRKAIAEGKNFTDKVCPEVAKYIIQNKLYK